MGKIELCAEADSFRHAEKNFDYAIQMTKELGLRYIEPEVMTGRCLLNVYGYCNITSLEDDPMEVRKHIEAAGLVVPCLSAHSNLLDTEYGVDYLKKAIRYAYILGSPMVNTAEGPMPGWMTEDDAFRIMKYNLDTLLEMAENYDITLTIEPHGVFTTNADGLLKIMSLSDSKRLAINFDTGNVTIAGNDAVETLKKVVKHVVHVHLKDVSSEQATDGHETGVTAGMAIGDGDVDIPGCIEVLKKNDYNGVLAIECSGLEAMKKSIEYLNGIL
ncbi:MAG: sugar phosphate isomerase/epimerase [Spirochaetota bacterium]|nr:MAG: sugar phosphate isomerase/epimerase [Spirochaetota bacterium]